MAAGIRQSADEIRQNAHEAAFLAGEPVSGSLSQKAYRKILDLVVPAVGVDHRKFRLGSHAAAAHDMGADHAREQRFQRQLFDCGARCR